MTGGGRPSLKVPSFDRSVGRDSNLDQKGPGREPLSQLLKVTSESKPGASFMATLIRKPKSARIAAATPFGTATEMLVSRPWRTLIRRQRYRGSDQM